MECNMKYKSLLNVSFLSLLLSTSTLWASANLWEEFGITEEEYKAQQQLFSGFEMKDEPNDLADVMKQINALEEKEKAQEAKELEAALAASQKLNEPRKEQGALLIEVGSSKSNTPKDPLEFLASSKGKAIANRLKLRKEKLERSIAGEAEMLKFYQGKAEFKEILYDLVVTVRKWEVELNSLNTTDGIRKFVEADLLETQKLKDGSFWKLSVEKEEVKTVKRSFKKENTLLLEVQKAINTAPKHFKSGESAMNVSYLFTKGNNGYIASLIGIFETLKKESLTTEKTFEQVKVVVKKIQSGLNGTFSTSRHLEQWESNYAGQRDPKPQMGKCLAILYSLGGEDAIKNLLMEQKNNCMEGLNGRIMQELVLQLTLRTTD
jgi:hypothetical protein